MQNFKAVHVEGNTIDETWFKLLVSLAENGRVYKIDEGSSKGDYRLEFDYVSGVIHNPISYDELGNRRPLAVTVPAGCSAPTTDKDIEEYFMNYLMNGETTPTEEYKYGTFIVGGKYKLPEVVFFNEVEGFKHILCSSNTTVMVPNQLQFCIDHYKEKGFGNNHCCIAVAYPESNLAYNLDYNNETERRTSPCLRMIDTKIIKSGNEWYLNLYPYFRSWDCGAGWPTNIGGISLLLEYMAVELGVNPGSIIFSSKGLHVYGYAFSSLKMKIGDTAYAQILEKSKGVA